MKSAVAARHAIQCHVAWLLAGNDMPILRAWSADRDLPADYFDPITATDPVTGCVTTTHRGYLDAHPFTQLRTEDVLTWEYSYVAHQFRHDSDVWEVKLVDADTLAIKFNKYVDWGIDLSNDMKLGSRKVCSAREGFDALKALAKVAEKQVPDANHVPPSTLEAWKADLASMPGSEYM